MSLRTLDQGIQAVKNGNLDEGARLIRIALKDETIQPAIRASGLMWLAETNADGQFKIECYRQALAIDPANQTVSQRLSQMMSSQLPPQTGIPSGNTPSQGMPPAGYTQPTVPLYPPQQNAMPSGNTPSQGMPPTNYPAGNTPSQGMPPANYPAQGSTPIQPYPPYNPQPPAGSTPPLGSPPYQSSPTVVPPQNMPGMPTQNVPGASTPNQFFTQQAVPNALPGQPAMTPPQRMIIPTPQRTVGIFGGPNGRGTGFFVTREGVVATTRFVVGGESDIEVELMSGQRLGGKVMRCFPQYDLALIQVNATVTTLLNVSQTPILPENAPIAIFPHGGEPLRSTRRETRHETATYWFPTLINRLVDAGGNPVFDTQNLLAGMMTRNASRANGYMYGLHITMIYRLVDQYHQELQQLSGQGTYCRHCGTNSRAGAFGGYYCETCGSVLPSAIEVARHPLTNVGALYGENMNRPCPYCQATVGYYGGQCLRCGQDVTGKV